MFLINTGSIISVRFKCCEMGRKFHEKNLLCPYQLLNDTMLRQQLIDDRDFAVCRVISKREGYDNIIHLHAVFLYKSS